MPGRWLSALARRLLRPQTFTLIASPAIADLQSEVRRDPRPAVRVRHVVAVWRAIGGGLRSDLAVDLAAATGRDAARGWVWGAVLFITAVAVATWTQLPRGLGLDILGGDGYLAMLVLRANIAAMTAIPLIVLPVAFVVARRRPQHRRAIAVCAVTIAAATLLHGLFVAPRVNRYVDEYYQAAVWRGRVEPEHMDRPLSEFVSHTYSHRRSSVPLPPPRPWFRSPRVLITLGNAAIVVLSLSILGSALARSYGWRLWFQALTLFALWELVGFALLRTQFMWEFAGREIWGMLGLLLIAALASVMTARRGRHPDVPLPPRTSTP